MNAAGRCGWPRCRERKIELEFYGVPLCRKHWDLTCDHLREAKKKLGVREPEHESP